MIDSRYFPNDNEKIEVVKAQYECDGLFPIICDLKRDIKKVPLVDCYKDLVAIICKGNTIYVPFIKTGTDTAGRMVRLIVKAFWAKEVFHKVYEYGKEIGLDLMDPDEEREKFSLYCHCRLLCNIISKLEVETKNGTI